MKLRWKRRIPSAAVMPESGWKNTLKSGRAAYGQSLVRRAFRTGCAAWLRARYFDVFAPDFEQVLHSLEYRAPDLILGFLRDIYGEKNIRK